MLSDPDFRELISLPLSPTIIHGLTRAGFNCISEIVGLSVDRLVSICGVSTKVARNALDVIHRYNHSSIECMDIMNNIGIFGLRTAWDLLNGSQMAVGENTVDGGKRCSYIVSMCRSFDDLLGGGFPTGRLTELCGEPGVGKTHLQACVNVQIPKWFSGLNGQALFLDTEGNFIPERVRQISVALENHCKRHFIEANPERTDESFIKQYCPTIRLIIVDSIALPFRYDFDDVPQRNRLLASVTQILLCIAGRQQAAVILTNQITTKFDAKHLNAAQFDCVFEEDEEQIRKDRNSCLVPALGDSWGHICSVRVFLTRLTTSCRQVQLLKHPGRPCGVGYYQITTGGIRDLIQGSKSNK
ncbi:DNA repair protein RAD51 like [Schistosoma japonicum]|nr:DNA repair protein RAD51 like [Schistosoma japonicum]